MHVSGWRDKRREKRSIEEAGIPYGCRLKVAEYRLLM